MYNPQIETFIFVAESGSFSKAAEAMYVTPTAVMKQINALENRLGIALFERTNHGLILTAAGKSFLQDAKYIMDYSARAIEKIRDIDAKANHMSIRIGTSVMTPAKFVLDIWAAIQHAAPNLKIEIIPFVNTPENARGILRSLGEQIDIVAGIYDNNLVNDNNFQTMAMKAKRILLAVPLTNSLVQKESISIADLKNSSVMLIRKGWNTYIDEMREALVNADIKIIDFDFFSLNAFNRAVKENIPIIAIDGWDNIHPLLKIVPVERNFEVPYGIMYSKEPSKQVKRFVDILKVIIDK